MEGIEVMKKQIGRLMAGATMAAVVAGVASYSQQRTEAATVSANVAVSASVAANCLVVTGGTMSFGAYDPLVANDTANLDADGTFTVRCTRGVTAQVGLDNGANYLGGTRRMRVGATANYLNYSLFSDGGRTTAWDNAASRVSYSATNKTAFAMTIYGRVPGGQDPTVGSYVDTVSAVAEF